MPFLGVGGSLLRWLLEDEQEDLYETLVALALVLAGLAVLALLLGPFGHLSLVFELARGYGILGLVLVVAAVLIRIVFRALKINPYDRSTLYVVLGLVTGAYVQTGWSAFAALSVASHRVGATGIAVWLLHFAGAASCLLATFPLAVVYRGTIYRLANLPVALASYAGFSLAPRWAEGLYGWFFRLF